MKAALLMIASYEIVMLHVFRLGSLDQRLATLELSPNVRQALNLQNEVKLAGAILSEEIAPPLPRGDPAGHQRFFFVEGFRYIMLIGAGLSVAGAITLAFS